MLDWLLLGSANHHFNANGKGGFFQRGRVGWVGIRAASTLGPEQGEPGGGFIPLHAGIGAHLVAAVAWHGK
jgi:hypothetical protein